MVNPTRRRWVWVLLAAGLTLLAACSARDTADEAPLPYRQAEDAFRLGHYGRAVGGYRVFLHSGEHQELVPRAFYRLALAEYRRGRYRECVEVIEEMRQRFPQREWSQVYELRGDAEQAMGNNVSAVRWWEFAWVAAKGDQKQASRRRIADALAGMDGGALAALRPLLSTSEIQQMVDTRMEESVSAGSPEPAAKRPRVAPAMPGEPALGDAIGPTPRVACLVPLSGRYATYGQRSLNGVRLALGAKADQLIVRDTQGQVQVARAVLDEIIAQPGIIAVIGPLRSSVAEAIAPRAERAGLPMIVLAQQEGISGRYIIQPVMTYERQAAALAEYAVEVLGLRRFGILYPQNHYGMALSEAFRREVERHQGRVVGTLVYGPAAHEFSVEVLSVDKWVDANGLQAVFIPDFAAGAVALATELRSVRPDLALLGSSGWHDPAVLGPAAKELEGTVFVDGFFVGSQRPATREFVAAYQREFQTIPQLLDAQAYDAATLLRRVLEKGARTREDVVPGLRALGTLDGAAGTVVVGPHGLRRQLFLLRLAAGAISEVSPMPSVPAGPAAVRPPAIPSAAQ